MKVASSRFSGLGRHMKIDPKTRPALEGERFQVIVIGGGINGVAIARDCARGGKRTLLVEQHDFASGTTSRSTRIIHGGLRYLEHAEIGLVRESLRERGRLVREKPHLAHPMHFVLALDENSRRSALAVRAGLWVYRRLGGRGLRPESAKEDQRKRSEEHTSELQSHSDLVCRLLLEKKKKKKKKKNKK